MAAANFLVASLVTARTAPMCKPTAAAVLARSAAAIEGLEPARLWHHFGQLAATPRVSKHEAAVLDLLKGVAAARGLGWTQDACGNLLIKAPGRGAGVGAAPVLIQNHIDMVTEKNSATVFDFLTEPIALRRDGDWLRADGTTLGADNGIGVSAALALLDEADPIDLPPLELLFTVDEETGLNGAKALDVRALGASARTLLNLDTEEWGQLYIGCAGGGDARITLPLARAAPLAGAHVLELRVEGLLGGHSGILIGDGLGNAVQLAARAAQSVLGACEDAGAPGALLAIDGGDKHNAIPREASALLAVPAAAADAAHAAVDAAHAAFRAEYGLRELHGSLALRPAAAEVAARAGAPLDADSTARLLGALIAIPHGPLKYSHAIPGLVETSNNLAAVATAASAAHVLCSSRSSVGPAMEGVRDKLRAVARTLGQGAVEFSPAYPGWQPNPRSRVLALAKEALVELLAREGVHEPPPVLAIHAGLECGLIGEKCSSAYGGGPGAEMDMVSFGPTIRGAHSPDEGVLISTVPKFYQLTKSILGRLALTRAA